jgi:thymidylate kinase
LPFPQGEWVVFRNCSADAVEVVPAEGPELRILRRPRRGHVVALSGLDGAGKSSQARALRETLERLGYETVVVWTPLGANPFVERVSLAARRLLHLLSWLGPLGRLERRLSEEGGSLVARPGQAAPRGRFHHLLAGGWATFLALVNAASQRRSALRHVRRGRIVVFDRYTLDSIVRLRFLHGGTRRFQGRLIRRLSPAPLCSFLLDVPPETALARKRDEWDLAALRRQAALYREEHGRLAVVRLDGERPREELCAEIAQEIRRRLRC